MRIGSLFTGSGMLDIAAAEHFGGKVVWHAERDKHASALLAARFPGVPNLGDVSTVDWREVELVDVLTGGFPCTDVSTAGKREGLAPHTRSGAWAHMADAIDVLRPRYVVIENVRGLRSAKAHRDADMEPGTCCVDDYDDKALRALGAVLGDLAGLGYDARWGSVRASDAGAPHQRERVFIVAEPADATQQRLNGTGEAGESGRDEYSDRNQPAADTRSQRHGGEQDGRMVGRVGAATESVGRPQRPARQEPGDRSEADGVTLLPTPRATDGTKGGPNQRGSSGDLMMPSAVQPTNFGRYSDAVARWENVVGPAPSPVIDGRLNPDFAEWMMGWPVGWTDVGISRSQRLKIIGNGVVPQQALLALSCFADETIWRHH